MLQRAAWTTGAARLAARVEAWQAWNHCARRLSTPGRASSEPVTGEGGSVDRQLRPVPGLRPAGHDLGPAIVGTSRFMCGRRTLRTARALDSWQPRLTARSSGGAGAARTPDVAWVGWWSLFVEVRAAAACARRKLQGRRKSTQNWEHRMLTSGLVGSRRSARKAYGLLATATALQMHNQGWQMHLTGERVASGRSPALPAIDRVDNAT